MINYNKNKLINVCLTKYYETFAHTLDTADYVPTKFNEKILLYIFKNMKRQFRKIDREDKQYQKSVYLQQKAAEKAKADSKNNSVVKTKDDSKSKKAAKSNNVKKAFLCGKMKNEKRGAKNGKTKE